MAALWQYLGGAMAALWQCIGQCLGSIMAALWGSAWAASWQRYSANQRCGSFVAAILANHSKDTPVAAVWQPFWPIICPHVITLAVWGSLGSTC